MKEGHQHIEYKNRIVTNDDREIAHSFSFFSRKRIDRMVGTLADVIVFLIGKTRYRNSVFPFREV